MIKEIRIDGDEQKIPREIVIKVRIFIPNEPNIMLFITRINLSQTRFPTRKLPVHVLLNPGPTKKKKLYSGLQLPSSDCLERVYYCCNQRDTRRSIRSFVSVFWMIFVLGNDRKITWFTCWWTSINWWSEFCWRFSSDLSNIYRWSNNHNK